MYEVISDAYGEWAQPVYQFTTPQFLSPGKKLCFVLHVFGSGVGIWARAKNGLLTWEWQRQVCDRATASMRRHAASDLQKTV